MTLEVRPPHPSRLATWCLAFATSRERASAILGDLTEELARRGETTRRVAQWWWIETQVWQHVSAEFGSSVPSVARTVLFAVRDAWRSQRSTPLPTLLAMSVLTLAISAATLTYSVVDAVVLRPLPFPAADRLAIVEHVLVGTERNTTNWTVSADTYRRLRDDIGSFAAVAAVSTSADELDLGGSPERVEGARVTASLFDVLSVRPALGAPFDATRETAGNENVAVIGDDLWHRRFGADRAVIGRTIRLNKRDVTIVAVMPPGFTYPIVATWRPQIWTPLVSPRDEGFGVYVVGRVAPGASLQAVDAKVTGMFAPVGTQATSSLAVSTRVRSLADSLAGAVRGWMLLVLAAVVMVLLVAYANVGNSLLTRATRRARELSMRAALGASRRYLFATLLIETLGLSLLAAGLSVLLVWWGIAGVRAALPGGIARAIDIAMNTRVFIAALSTAVATGVIFGLIPAWQATRHDLVSLLSTSGHRFTERGRWRSAFLVTQVAFVTMLLVATALFVGSFVRVSTSDLGFDRRHLVTAARSSVAGSVVDVSEMIRKLPGVAAVGAYSGGAVPLADEGHLQAGQAGSQAVRLVRMGADIAADPSQAVFLRTLRVSHGYFAAAGVAVREGREFLDEELGARDAVVLDEATAKRLFAHESAIGQSVLYAGETTATVVGVVADVRDRGPELPSNLMLYLPTGRAAGDQHWLVKTSGDSASLVPQLEATLDGLASGGGRPAVVRPLEDAFRTITEPRRFAARLMSVFGVLALVIGLAGVYGVTLSIVVQRTREIGIRVALGATPERIVSGVVREAGLNVVVGLAVGLALGLAMTRAFGSIFFGVRPTDAAIYATVSGAILVAGVLAALFPARQAARIDPQITLRAE